MSEPITVSQFTNYLKRKMDQDPNLKGVEIKGELSNVSAPNYSGHRYFAIKDQGAVLKCVMFKSAAQKLDFDLKNGVNVVIKGTGTIYPNGGYHQVIVTDVKQEDTTGDLYKKLLEIKERLEKKGYLDKAMKKPIPQQVKKVAIITSLTSAAMQDMKSTIMRRNRFIQMDCYESLMQGEQAANDVMGCLHFVDQKDYDVIIIGRGGGSMEDLWAFNDERLAEAIFNARTPIISAIGHETDYTIADFVADWRAATPTAAAEIVSSITMENLAQQLFDMKRYANDLMLRMIEQRKQQAKHLKLQYEKFNPMVKQQQQKVELSKAVEKANWLIQTIINNHKKHISQAKMAAENKNPMIIKRQKEMELKNMMQRVNSAMNKKMTFEKEKFGRAMEKAEVLNPFTTLKRGYSAVYKDEKIIKDVTEIEIHDTISVVMSNGSLLCTVNNKKTNEGVDNHENDLYQNQE